MGCGDVFRTVVVVLVLSVTVRLESFEAVEDHYRSSRGGSTTCTSFPPKSCRPVTVLRVVGVGVGSPTACRKLYQGRTAEWTAIAVYVDRSSVICGDDRWLCSETSHKHLPIKPARDNVCFPDERHGRYTGSVALQRRETL